VKHGSFIKIRIIEYMDQINLNGIFKISKPFVWLLRLRVLKDKRR